MDARLAARHAHALDIARRALLAGARPSTVGFVPGLDRSALRRYFLFEAGEGPRPGKRPDSPERFIKNATLFTMIDASVVYAIYHDHRDRSPYPAEALLAAYACYVTRRTSRELSFDRVFYVVSWTDRLWAGRRGRPSSASPPAGNHAAIWPLRRRSPITCAIARFASSRCVIAAIAASPVVSPNAIFRTWPPNSRVPWAATAAVRISGLARACPGSPGTA